jgi:hypothetical protein
MDKILGMTTHALIPEFGKLRQEDCEFKASLLYSKTLSQNITQQKNKTNQTKWAKDILKWEVCLALQ